MVGAVFAYAMSGSEQEATSGSFSALESVRRNRIALIGFRTMTVITSLEMSGGQLEKVTRETGV